MTTAEVVHAFLERLGTGDVEGVTELFADDIDWWAPGTVLPWAGRRSRRSEVPEFFRSARIGLRAWRDSSRGGEGPHRR